MFTFMLLHNTYECSRGSLVICLSNGMMCNKYIMYSKLEQFLAIDFRRTKPNTIIASNSRKVIYDVENQLFSIKYYHIITCNNVLL